MTVDIIFHFRITKKSRVWEDAYKVVSWEEEASQLLEE